METPLSKAKAALLAAKGLDVDLEADTLPQKYHRLLDLAAVQAGVAQADALVGILAHLTRVPPNTGPG